MFKTSTASHDPHTLPSTVCLNQLLFFVPSCHLSSVAFQYLVQCLLQSLEGPSSTSPLVVLQSSFSSSHLHALWKSWVGISYNTLRHCIKHTAIISSVNSASEPSRAQPLARRLFCSVQTLCSCRKSCTLAPRFIISVTYILFCQDNLGKLFSVVRSLPYADIICVTKTVMVPGKRHLMTSE